MTQASCAIGFTMEVFFPLASVVLYFTLKIAVLNESALNWNWDKNLLLLSECSPMWSLSCEFLLVVPGWFFCYYKTHTVHQKKKNPRSTEREDLPDPRAFRLTITCKMEYRDGPWISVNKVSWCFIVLFVARNTDPLCFMWLYDTKFVQETAQPVHWWHWSVLGGLLPLCRSPNTSGYWGGVPHM